MIDVHDYPEASRVFAFFEELAAIPHGSGNTEKISAYLENFAQERGLFCIRDAAGNVLIRKNASKGREDRPAVILQGHIDMVAVKVPGSSIDLEKDGLKLYRDGDFLRAEGTSLGGDDGIAVAYALALLDDEGLAHPEIEALFTVDEEIGLLGAASFDCSSLRGRTMINVDSDDEGVFIAGCAGGLRADITVPVSRISSEGEGYRLKIKGLHGGHSGAEIHLGYANANKLLAEFLSILSDVKIASLSGGNADNAIPRNAEAVFSAEGDVCALLHAEYERRKSEIGKTDPDFGIEVTKARVSRPADEKSSARVLAFLSEAPMGVQAMSEDIPGLVETSLNLGILETSENAFTASFSLRSSKAKAKADLLEKLKKTAHGVGASVETHGDYPGWEYKKDSRLREVLCEVYRNEYGKDAEVVTIHAGLECGIFSDKMPGLDCVSLGPDNFDIHTTEEHLSISSSARVFTFLKKVLAKM